MGSEQAEDSVSPREAEGADSGFRPRSRIMAVLRSAEADHRLARGATTLGRSAACDIQVTGELVSRRHARVTLDDRGVTVEDLGSRNGVYVNTERVAGVRTLGPGDRLAIGEHTLVLHEYEEAADSQRAATLAALPAQHPKRDSFSDDETSVATRSADVFQLLGHVVDKALALGRGEEAEHLIAAHLVAALADATSPSKLSPEIARAAAGYAVKLASATGKASWLDYAVKLYGALDLVLPLALVDEMYVLLRRVRGIDIGLLRAYTEELRRRALGLTPTDRFVLQRLIGLERLAAWQSSTSGH